METPFSQWLADRIDRRGLRANQVAAYLGVSEGAVSKWLNGQTTPRAESCAKLAQLFHVPIAEVYYAAGIPTPDYVPPERQNLSPREVIMDALADFPVAVPVLEQFASAGEGQLAMDTVYLPPSRAAGRNLRVMRIRGDSMEPEIREGDTVVFDTDLAWEHGDIVVASVGDEVFAKRIERKRDAYVLVGNNGKIIPGDDAHIIGKVIQIVRDVA